MTNLPDPVLNHIGKQADEIIEPGTEWSDFGAELDVSRYTNRDSYAEWHAGVNDFEPMFLAVLWATAEEESVTGLSDRLEDNPDIATAFGFDVDDLPHGDTFARAWRNRFEELQGTIKRSADQIDDVATKPVALSEPAG